MPPTSDGISTVGCNLARLVPDAGHLDAIRQAVASTHKATILATELLNMHVRRLLRDEGADLCGKLSFVMHSKAQRPKPGRP